MCAFTPPCKQTVPGWPPFNWAWYEAACKVWHSPPKHRCAHISLNYLPNSNSIISNQRICQDEYLVLIGRICKRLRISYHASLKHYKKRVLNQLKSNIDIMCLYMHSKTMLIRTVESVSDAQDSGEYLLAILLGQSISSLIDYSVRSKQWLICLEHLADWEKEIWTWAQKKVGVAKQSVV